MLNRDIVKIYLNSSRSKAKVVEFFVTNDISSEQSAVRDVDKWIRQFLRRWSHSHARDRFYERNKDWLDTVFLASETNTPVLASSSSNEQTPSVRGRQQTAGQKRRLFENLSERTKNERSKMLAKTEPLEKLLRSAEKAARRKSLPNTVKVLRSIISGSEAAASKMLGASPKSSKLTEASADASLLLKTRLGLSKSKYQSVERFTKQVYGTKLLQPWSKLMEHRNNIIPKISTPSWEDGVLTAHVTLRDMVATDVARILELDEVNTNISKLGRSARDGPVECVLHVSAGVDSATGFSHYNQDKILKQDDSLLSEHVMPLMLVANEIRLWENPNPQSDTFCHAKSMRWMKEKDTITRKIFVDFYEEVHEIERRPIIIPAKVHGIDLSIRVSAFYAMVDGKAANAIVQNRDTHACPLCVKSADLRVGPAFFHSRLNAVEWLIRVTAQKHVPGHPAQAHSKVKEKAREIADRLEEKYKMNVNRPKIGGSGSSNNGNMARRLLADSESFASILGISKRLVEVIRLISCLALSSRKLDGKKIQELNAEMEDLLKQEFPFVKRIPPCIHKYRHLPEIIERLPYTLNFIDEQSGERCHKRYKHARPNLARKTSPEDNLLDMMRMSLAWSDTKIAHLEAKKRHEKSNDPEFARQMEWYHADIGTDRPISGDESSSYSSESEAESEPESDIVEHSDNENDIDD